MAPGTLLPPNNNSSLFDDDEDGWQDMPVVREDDLANILDEEDKKKYHYVTPQRTTAVTNATGNLIDFDDSGNEWREKNQTNESDYTRLRLNEENENDEVHLRTRYLFDEDKAMTPLSQMQATKNLLTEAQRIAYVGLCALTLREMIRTYKLTKAKELKSAIESMENWALKIMGRIYYHMELETQEQKMIDNLEEHGIQAADFVPPLLTTHTVANPEYDPLEARRQAAEKELSTSVIPDVQYLESATFADESAEPTTPKTASQYQTTANVLAHNAPVSVPGVSTTLSSTDENVTLDIRWTVLCDLFLILIADSVYDARSRVLLESVATKLGLGWLDVVKFEQRVTEALEIQEDVERLEQKDVLEGRMKAARRRRYAMVGLATIGGGLVIGLSAGLLAPVIGAGLGAAFATVGITGTTGFLAGAGGAAVITTAGTLTGSGIAAKGMARRTRQVGTFELLPLHNNKRVNCILTVPGFMTSLQDDVRLPFSVLDPIVGDVFSVRWEPEMLGEAGSAIKILSSEVLSQVGQTVLQATVMTALMSALQWPLLLTKLGYLIDNPWSNALDRAQAAGYVLADVLIQRHLGVRPITLMGFSLGARVIYYCLLELARKKAFGIVQDVFLLGATVTAPRQSWLQARSVVAGRLVNCYARNDWLLNYLFRATNAGLNSIAGLRPVQNVPGVENVDVTDKIAGHSSYRVFVPLILDQLGFPVLSDYFDEPEEFDMTQDRTIVREEQDQKKKSWFSRKSKPNPTPSRNVSRPPSGFTRPASKVNGSTESVDDDLPGRLEKEISGSPPETLRSQTADGSDSNLPTHAGFDLGAIKDMIEKEGAGGKNEAEQIREFPIPTVPAPTLRSESTPLPVVNGSRSPTPTRAERFGPGIHNENAEAGPSSKSDLNISLKSLSVNDLTDSSRHSLEDDTLGSILKTSYFTEDFSQFTSSGALSFGGSDGSLWLPDNESGEDRLNSIPTSVFPEKPHPSSAANTSLLFGATDRSIWVPPPPPKDVYKSSSSVSSTFQAFRKSSSFELDEENLFPLPAVPSSSLPHNHFSHSSATLAVTGPTSTSPQDESPGINRSLWQPPSLNSGEVKRPSPALDLNPWQ